MKEKEQVKPEQAQEQTQPQSMNVPPELAAQIKAQMEAQAIEKSVTEQINMLLKANNCVIHVGINIDSQFGLQPGWRVVKLK